MPCFVSLGGYCRSGKARENSPRKQLSTEAYPLVNRCQRHAQRGPENHNNINSWYGTRRVSPAANQAGQDPKISCPSTKHVDRNSANPDSAVRWKNSLTALTRNA